MSDEIDDVERRILRELPTSTYEELSSATGLSRGKIYAIALKHGARKNELRIRERAADRRRRQWETLAEIVDSIATADVLDFLDSLPDGDAASGVDAHVFSPPYNVGKAYGDNPSSDAMRHLYYMGWLAQIVSECARTLREGGVLALQVGSTRDNLGGIVPIDMLVYDYLIKAGLTLQNRIVWQVPHGLTPSARLAGRHETVLIATKGPAPRHFNANAARIPQKQPGKRAFKGPNKGSLSGHPLGAWPIDVWAIPNVGHNAVEKTGHPCQMPIELARRLVQLYTMPGDLVVDPFAGSGTTAVAAIEGGRRFTGCDLIYEDMRARRLAAAGLADVCPLPGVTDGSVAVWQAEARRRDVAADGTQLDLLHAA